MISVKNSRAQNKALRAKGYTIVAIDTGKTSHPKYTVSKDGVLITGIISWTDYTEGVVRIANKCFSIAKANGWSTINAGTKTGA